MATSGGKRSKVLSNKSGFKQNIIKVCGIYPQTPSCSQICMVSHTFYPKLPIFLNRYICHICEISQLCSAVITHHSLSVLSYVSTSSIHDFSFRYSRMRWRKSSVYARFSRYSFSRSCLFHFRVCSSISCSAFSVL